MRYALVLTDLSLPGISGEEMLRPDARPQPDAWPRSFRAGIRTFRSRSTPGFLQKPYVPKMLAEMIEKKLASK